VSVTIEEARALDAADPLRHLRDRFMLPEGIVYLDGNSLGMLPAETVRHQQEVVLNQWGTSLIRSWNDHGWIEAPQRIGARMAPSRQCRRCASKSSRGA
jgi:kynureninase